MNPMRCTLKSATCSFVRAAHRADFCNLHLFTFPIDPIAKWKMERINWKPGKTLFSSFPFDPFPPLGGMEMENGKDTPPVNFCEKGKANMEGENSRTQKNARTPQRKPKRPRCGEEHAKARLTDHEVQLMRSLHERKGAGYKNLARRFEVAVSTVQSICTYRTRFNVL